MSSYAEVRQGVHEIEALIRGPRKDMIINPDYEEDRKWHGDMELAVRPEGGLRENIEDLFELFASARDDINWDNEKEYRRLMRGYTFCHVPFFDHEIVEFYRWTTFKAQIGTIMETGKHLDEEEVSLLAMHIAYCFKEAMDLKAQ